jgi:D-glucuronyl C5-epimerase-like protein
MGSGRKALGMRQKRGPWRRAAGGRVSEIRTRALRAAHRFQDPHPEYHEAALPLPYDPAGEYLYFRSLSRPRRRPLHTDPEGIVMFRREGRWVHNPATTAAQGLLELSHWSVHETEEDLADAIHIGQWLCGTQDAVSGKWAYEFDYRLAGFKKGLQAPWPSALAQGHAISLLTRLYRVTGDNGYLTASRCSASTISGSSATTARTNSSAMGCGR